MFLPRLAGDKKTRPRPTSRPQLDDRQNQRIGWKAGAGTGREAARLVCNAAIIEAERVKYATHLAEETYEHLLVVLVRAAANYVERVAGRMQDFDGS